MFGCIGFLLFTAFGLFQLVAAFDGAKLYMSGLVAFLMIFGSLGIRFTLPITIFAFLGAKNAWGWEWYWAALFAAPGLVLVVPAFLAQLIESASRTLRRR